MHPIDRLVSTFSPESGVRRWKARRVLDYAQKTGFWRQAAQQSTNRKMSGQPLDHPDGSRNHSDRITMIREARHLEENNPIIASILLKYDSFVVGRLPYIPRTKSPKANKQIKDYLERWFRYADITGRHSFRTLVSLALRSMIRDGDVGFIIHKVDEQPEDSIEPVSRIRLQAIEADRIGAVWNAGAQGSSPFKPLKKTEQDFSGVVVDRLGRPVRYRIFTRNKQIYDGLVPWRDVPAKDFLHLFDPIRHDGYRAFSAFGTSHNDIKDIQEMLACEKQSVKYLCSRSGFIVGGDGTAPEDVDLDGNLPNKTTDGVQLSKIEAGAIEHLPQGHDFKEVDSNRPSPTFNGFIETLTRWVAQSFKLPYGFVYSWASQGTAVRMEAAQADREFQRIQLLIEEKLLNPLIRIVLADAVKEGHIDKVPDYDEGEWRYPAKVTADVGRESKALIEENMGGLISKTQIAADRGEDRVLVREFLKSEALELIEDAKAIVDASGGAIDLKLALFMLEKRSPNAPTEPPEPTAKPEADDDE
jgi:lambda family phage portal protein